MHQYFGYYYLNTSYNLVIRNRTLISLKHLKIQKHHLNISLCADETEAVLSESQVGLRTLMNRNKNLCFEYT